MDRNLLAGSKIIKHNQKKLNLNGKMFEMYLHKNPNLSVVNALTLCKRVFIRVNTTKTGTCKGILDFFVVCDKILPYVTKVEIDDNGKF